MTPPEWSAGIEQGSAGRLPNVNSGIQSRQITGYIMRKLQERKRYIMNQTKYDILVKGQVQLLTAQGARDIKPTLL